MNTASNHESQIQSKRNILFEDEKNNNIKLLKKLSSNILQPGAESIAKN